MALEFLSFTNHNVGVYWFDVNTNRATLVTSYYDAQASTLAATSISWVSQTDESFSGTSPSAPSGDGSQSIDSCGAPSPPTMPTVTTTARRPSGMRYSGHIFRLRAGSNWFGGGRNAIRLAGTGNSTMNCGDQSEHRLTAANAAAQIFKPRARQGDDFRVNNADGSFDIWTFACGGPACGTALKPEPRIPCVPPRP